MNINKAFEKELSFSEYQFPEILCPWCHKGHLVFDKKNQISSESEDSIMCHTVDDWDASWVDERFIGTLNCSSPDCKDVVFCIGEIKYEYQENVIEDFDEMWVPNYYPRYFMPSLEIIPLTHKYPNLIIDELKGSFSLFFTDIESCANKIRICVEILMNEQKIRKTRISKSKRVMLKLHDRIIEFQSKSNDVGSKLLAIKWIGNAGSHYSKLTIEDLLDAYNLLNYCMIKLYDDEDKKIEKLAIMINKKKLPLSKKNKKNGT